MSWDWKRNLALQSYYALTSPIRRWADRSRRISGTCPVMVLFYHRVADRHLNDWTMTCEAFEIQIGWLRENFDLVTLEEAQQRLQGPNKRPAVAITFDDGYADNCRFALPLLIKQRIPCTYFVSLYHVQHEEAFPHDVKHGIPLRPNSLEELRGLSVAGIEIGAHSRTHADLGTIKDEHVLHDELVLATRELGDLVGQTIRYFAFPYGQHVNMSASSFRMAKEMGMQAVVSAYGGYNFPGDDPFHLQRIHADPQLIRLKNWLTVDPRKKRLTQRFEYDLDVVSAETVLV